MLKLKLKNKLSKYINLLSIIKKNCNGKCNANYERLISYLDDNSINFLCQCIRNTLDPNNFSLLQEKKKKRLFKKVAPFRKDIKSILKSNISTKIRKQRLQKGGAFFLPLISAVLPLITSLIASKIKKKTETDENQ